MENVKVTITTLDGAVLDMFIVLGAIGQTQNNVSNQVREAIENVFDTQDEE